jgi:hypothetical protein
MAAPRKLTKHFKKGTLLRLILFLSSDGGADVVHVYELMKTEERELIINLYECAPQIVGYSSKVCTPDQSQISNET